MSNQIILKNSGTSESIPTLSDLVYGELAVNYRDAKVYFKVNDGITDRIEQINANTPIANTIFIQTYPTGNDANDGRTWDTAVATFERALEIADERKTLDPYAITLIDVGAGRYLTEGHLDMPDDTIIRAVHRSVVVGPVPGYEETNQFRMGSGCFIEGIVFEGWRLDSLDDPTEGFAVSFRPGAVIRRVPYAHKIAVRTIPTWGTVPPPLNAELGNPFVPRGAGVALADGAIISPYSIFPNIMTWGATPVVANGVGYCAKNGGLINAVNAISLWAHKHFLALSGGQIILSACSTQFGDYTMWSEGKRDIIYPTSVTGVILEPRLYSACRIINATDEIVDNMWIALSTTINPATGQVYTYGWTPIDEVYTRRDGANFIQCMVWVLQSADQIPMENFAKGFYDTAGISIIDPDKLDAFLFAWENMRDQMIAIVLSAIDPNPPCVIGSVPNVNVNPPNDPQVTLNAAFPDAVNGNGVIDETTGNLWVYYVDPVDPLLNIWVIYTVPDTKAEDIINALVVALNTTTLTPTKRPQPSTITAIGHTWSAVSAGVALTKIPPAFNRTTIEGSIREVDDGLVIASGQDDQGSALFVGGMKISADTGELSGPPFDQAVGRIATKSAIAFSNF